MTISFLCEVGRGWGGRELENERCLINKKVQIIVQKCVKEIYKQTCSPNTLRWDPLKQLDDFCQHLSSRHNITQL